MRKLLATPLVSAIIGGGMTAAVLIGAGVVDDGDTRTVYEQRPLTAGVTSPRAAGAAGDALTARDIYKRDAPGVAFIRARALQPTESPFDVYTDSTSSESTGSGFVLDDNGRILTNAHVIENATEVMVTLSGKTTRSARIVGKDESTDLALLQIDAKGLDLQPLELGRSADVEVGDPTVAIGNPFGFDRTLTTGVVSAIQRRISAPDGYTIENVIQTDAAINPGNSGGPLIDAAGRVIGINSQIATGGSGSGSVGIGFAVPIDTAKEVVGELIDHGRVERPWLGVEFVPIDDTLRDAFDAGVSKGLLVQRVIPGSPSSRAGIVGGDRISVLSSGEQVYTGGDVVTRIDGVECDSSADVRRALDKRRPGDTVSVEIVRSGKRQKVEVTLANRPPGNTGG